MQITVVFSKPLALALKFLTEAAQVPVSILGKIFNTNFFPAKSESETTPRSLFTNLKSGAFEPIFGNSPLVFTGFPPNVTVAIFLNFIRFKSMKNIFVKLP
ncbi:hypothetical protein D3C86_1695280 [compost metagenome]